MTTFEHAMLGINGVLATGLHRRFGWQLAAVGGLAAVSPDWDGCTLLISVELFDRSHRVWGHNLFACVLLGALIGWCEHRFQWTTRAARLLARRSPLDIPAAALVHPHTVPRQTVFLWVTVGMLGALSQLPADLVVSGTETLNDWPLQLLWPFSRREWIYPLVPWGDVGVTVLFVCGMLAMTRWRQAVPRIARCTLAAVFGYLVLRGWLRAW